MDAGLERSLLIFIKQDDYLKLCERTLNVRGFPVREESKVAWLESPDGLGATARISSSLTEVKQNIGRRNRALRGNETRTPDAKTKTSGQLSTQSFPRSLKSRVFKLAIAMARSLARDARALPRRLQQLIRIDVDGDRDIFGEWQLVQCLADEPAQTHNGLAADQDVKSELAL